MKRPHVTQVGKHLLQRNLDQIAESPPTKATTGTACSKAPGRRRDTGNQASQTFVAGRSTQRETRRRNVPPPIGCRVSYLFAETTLWRYVASANLVRPVPRTRAQSCRQKHRSRVEDLNRLVSSL